MIGIIVCTKGCNLACEYCYERAKAKIRGKSRAVSNNLFEQERPLLSDFVKTVSMLADKGGRTAQIILHGGEPLLIQKNNLLAFLEDIRDVRNIRVQIQTNGTLITSALADVLQRYNVGVVISLDGPEKLHNAFRVNAARRGTFDRVMHSIELLKERDVQVSALTTITEQSKGKAGELYSFFNDNRMDFSVNRCFSVPSVSTSGSITEEEYKNFLSELYDIYRQKAANDVTVPCFDRCIHDLKEEPGGYVYSPLASPHISIYDIELHSVKFLTEKKIYTFDDFKEYGAFMTETMRSHIGGGSIRYIGSLKQCVIDHLCRQQIGDFANAMEVYV